MLPRSKITWPYYLLCEYCGVFLLFLGFFHPEGHFFIDILLPNGFYQNSHRPFVALLLAKFMSDVC